MKQKLKKKIEGIVYGSKEWEDAVKKVAEMLDSIDKFFWEIGMIAVRIPAMFPEWKSSKLKNFNQEFTPLQQFAIEVQKQTKRYKDWKSAYTRISQARALVQEYLDEETGKLEIEEGLPINHHVVASKLIPSKDIPVKGKTRKEWLQEAKEKQWSARELAEAIQPERYRLEYESVEGRYFEFKDSLEKLEETMDWFVENGYEGLSQTRKNGMVRSLFVFVKSYLPRFLKHIEEEGDAKLDPLFRKFVEKIMGS